MTRLKGKSRRYYKLWYNNCLWEIGFPQNDNQIRIWFNQPQHRHIGGHKKETNTVTKYAKMEFPLYHGTEDPLSCLNRFDQSFNSQNTAAHEKVRMEIFSNEREGPNIGRYTETRRSRAVLEVGMYSRPIVAYILNILFKATHQRSWPILGKQDRLEINQRGSQCYSPILVHYTLTSQQTCLYAGSLNL